MKLDWTRNDVEDGVNIDDDLSEEEIGQRFTNLRPNGPRQNERNNRGRLSARGGQQNRRDEGRNYDRKDRFYGGQGGRRDNRSKTESARSPPRQKAEPPKKKQEKFDAQNLDNFPSF